MIYVYGSVARDFIFDYSGKISDEINNQKLNLSFIASKFRETRGGTAANIAYNLSLLDLPCGILSSVGKDSTCYCKWLDSFGIDIDNISIEDEFTSSSALLTDQVGNQIIIFSPGAMNKVVSSCLVHFNWIEASFIIIGAGVVDGINYVVSMCIKNSIDYLYNPGQSIFSITSDCLSHAIQNAKILLFNEAEYLYAKEILKWDETIFLQNGKILAITFGENGSSIRTLSSNFYIEAVRIPMIDTTGAGDAYCAGLVKGIFLKLPLEISGKLASLVASYTLGHFGSIEHTFTLDELSKQFQDCFGIEIDLY